MIALEAFEEATQEPKVLFEMANEGLDCRATTKASAHRGAFLPGERADSHREDKCTAAKRARFAETTSGFVAGKAGRTLKLVATIRRDERLRF